MKPLYWAAASGPLALVLWWLAALSPATVEAWYSRAFYPAVMAPWSRLTGLVPFPVFMLFLAAIAAVLAWQFFSTPFWRALSLVGATLSVLVAWFVLGWGLNYQRQSWAENHSLASVGGTVADLERLATRLAVQTGPLRAKAAADPVSWSEPEWRHNVSLAYERAGASDPLLAGRYGDPKPFPFPDLMSWLGIAGICIPHTGEPMVNPGPNGWMLPFTAAHEAAHLRGWAREDEANFLAFWVLRDDPHPALAYSAWSSALLYTATALEESGPVGSAAWGRVLAGLDAGVLKDWKEEFAYWDRFKGPAREAAQAVNDAYLKSQGQSLGVKSYGRMVDLLLAWSASESPSVPEKH